MQVTGHRSIEGVQAYKRACPDQFQEISEVLQGIDHVDKEKVAEKVVEKPTVTPKTSAHATDFGGVDLYGSNNQITININKY